MRFRLRRSWERFQLQGLGGAAVRVRARHVGVDRRRLTSSSSGGTVEPLQRDDSKLGIGPVSSPSSRNRQVPFDPDAGVEFALIGQRRIKGW
jgi:hypothetical protein